MGTYSTCIMNVYRLVVSKVPTTDSGQDFIVGSELPTLIWVRLGLGFGKGYP